MKKFLVITVLALLLALPVIAVTNWDFTASGTDGNVIATLTLNGTDTNIIIASSSKALSLTINASGTLDIVNAATSTFKIYPAAASTVNAIKIASSSTNAYTSCTTFTDAIATPIVIASTTDAVATSTVTLISLSHAITYNHFCGAASCANGYEVSGSNADAICSTCPTLTGAATYNTGTCGAASCITNYTLTGSGASAYCVPPSSIFNPSSGGGSSTGSSAEDNTVVTNKTPAAPATSAEQAAKATDQIKNIVAEAATIAGRSVEQVLAAVGAMKDAKAEAAAEKKYTANLISGLKNITAEIKTAITTFVNYGTPTTKVLGAGERAGVVNSYKSAFGKVPSSESEWSDAIKIGNGRWPSEKSAAAEAKATAEFKKVYKRSPDMKQPNDNAAVTVISYGLRPSARNQSSEKAAIKSFKAIYGHAPVSATAWDIVRAIAYSGAKR